MFIHQSTIGFIFKQQERGEADKIFSIFSQNFGRIEILGKGIRKISSKLRGGMEVFSISQIEFVEGKFQKRLVGVQLIERFKNLKKDLKKLSTAFKISDILDFLIKGQEKEKRIFRLLKETFSKLNSSSFKKEKVLYLYFFWNLISILGYKPQLRFCSFCQKKKNQKFYFNFSSGGLICEECFKNVKIGERIDSNSIKLIKLLLKGDINFLERLRIEKEALNLVSLLSEKYLKFLAEKNETL
jgi:DNA repair protein RecO (recombination protein O)